jgi:signal peptidase
MEGKENNRDLRTLFARFRTSDHWALSLIRDIIWLMAVVGGIALALYLICGTWPAVVAIESKSMDPHMKIGDLVVVIDKDRFGDLQTWAGGKTTGYRKFEDYGDVIIYQPNGARNQVVPIPLISGGVHPVIHRAIDKVDTEQLPEYLALDLANISKFYKPHGGYITKGDNNRRIDQVSIIQGVGVIEPVKDEWIIGKALFTVPLIGYLPLNIVWVTVIVIILMLLHEWYLHSLEEKEERPRKKKGIEKK